MEGFQDGKRTKERVSDTKNVILVYYGGNTKKEEKERFKKYLTENKFRLYLTGPLGFGNCPWRFINLDNKIMVLGKPGIEFAKPYIKHAVLIDEFIEINEFYKKNKILDSDFIKSISNKYYNSSYFSFR